MSEQGYGPVTRAEFNRLDKDVNGNGQPGMRQNVETILLEMSAIRGAQDERAKIDRKRWHLQAIILSILTLVVAVIGILEAIHEHSVGELNWPKIFISRHAQRDYAVSIEPQDASRF